MSPGSVNAMPRGSYNNIHYQLIEKVPESLKRRTARASESLRAVEELLQSPTGVICAFSDIDDANEMRRFYTNMLQWKERYQQKYPDLQVRKHGDEVYLWFESAQDRESPATAPRSKSQARQRKRRTS